MVDHFWWAKVDGRQNCLRDVVGGPVIIDTPIPTESSSLFGWACFDDRQNHLELWLGSL